GCARGLRPAGRSIRDWTVVVRRRDRETHEMFTTEDTEDAEGKSFKIFFLRVLSVLRGRDLRRYRAAARDSRTGGARGLSSTLAYTSPAAQAPAIGASQYAPGHCQNL